MRTVGQLAALTGLSVRTLHHYEEIGLLVPGERSESGYRQYGDAELERLQEILGWRALGFALNEIKTLLDDPDHDRLQALRDQRELVQHDLARMRTLAAALDRAIDAHATDSRQQEEQMFEGFEYADEARERWGHTEAYQESARRTKAYSAADWEQIRAEAEAITGDFAALKRAGSPADGDDARAVAVRHRAHLTSWFYDCTPAIHAGLAEMYVADERFADHYDRVEPGLARYVRDAILAST